VDRPADAAFDPLQFGLFGLKRRALGDAQPVHFAMELFAEDLEQVRLEQVPAQSVEDRCLEDIEADVQPVAAGATIAGGGAAEQVGADLDVLDPQMPHLARPVTRKRGRWRSQKGRSRSPGACCV